MSIQRILVVGGGSSGWLAAAYLQRMYNRVDPARVEITLVESPDVGIIGVGEATVPSLVGSLQFLGINEREFMRRTHASYKQAIRFEHWRADPQTSPGNYFYHPFERPGTLAGLPLHLALSSRLGRGEPERFTYDMLAQPWMCDAMRAPKVGDETITPYAFHMDAVLMGRYLREIACGRGVKHIEATIDQVSRRDDGGIAAVHTRCGQRLEADLFIDCSGFQSLLLGQTLEEPFVNYADALFCDKAVALQVPMSATEEIKPFTTSSASKAGWIWEIQLRRRRGMGHVYSSRYMSADQAEEALRRHIGPAAEGLNARHLSMRVGRSHNFWIKNCVAIGLSGGFIEPLESTGIYLVEIGLKLLLDLLGADGIHERHAHRYNQMMQQQYDQIRDFIVLHYCLTEREDSDFWRDNKYNPNLPDSLKHKLELWQHRHPSSWDDDQTGGFFNHMTYLFIMAGMGRLPALNTAYCGHVPEAEAYQKLTQLQQQRLIFMQHAPSHRSYLENTIGALD